MRLVENIRHKNNGGEEEEEKSRLFFKFRVKRLTHVEFGGEIDLML